MLALVNQALRGWGLPGVSEHLLRKAAHFAEFTALGWWLLLCARAFAARAVRRMPWLWGAGILCAAADEGIQFFVPGPFCAHFRRAARRLRCTGGPRVGVGRHMGVGAPARPGGTEEIERCVFRAPLLSGAAACAAAAFLRCALLHLPALRAFLHTGGANAKFCAKNSPCLCRCRLAGALSA